MEITIIGSYIGFRVYTDSPPVMTCIPQRQHSTNEVDGEFHC